MERERVAVVGSGVSGLTAAYLLSRRYQVTLFEADDRIGGHAHTHDVLDPRGGLLAIDSGFIVHNTVTYPLLRRLFAELNVPTQPTEMSMSIRCDGCGLEYAGGRAAGGVLARPGALRRPGFARLLAQVPRFHRRARRLLAASEGEPTLGEFLADGHFSPYFVSHFVVPLVAAVWSTPPGKALRYPARYLFAFLANHGMLTVRESHQWYTVVGGSRTYVERIAKQLTAVRTATPVRAVSRAGETIVVHDDAGARHHFDRAVIATHADTARSLLADISDVERAILGSFTYSHNDTVLHTDDRLLPRAARARASWNYLMPTCTAAGEVVCVSYDLNRLQRLPAADPHLVSLNAGERIDPPRILARMTYRHPVYTPESVAAQRRLPELNSPRLAFAGAYHGWGFHEDGCRAGVAAAAALGVRW